MPIPTPETTPAPRRLLRDVVFDKLLAAIGDGTLELGERLNDDELVSWLGVSRTPVREAIAKLSDFGLVDIEANRYTRVVQPTMDEVDDTLNAALGVWSLAARRAATLMDDAQRKEFRALAKSVTSALKAKKSDHAFEFKRLVDGLVQYAASPSLTRMEETVGARTALILRLSGPAFSVENAVAFTDSLVAAIDQQDGEAAASVLVGPETQEYATQLLDGLREQGTFSA